MKADVIDRKTHKLDIFFDGESYVFNDSVRGLFAIAKRDYRYALVNEGKQHFKLYYGNSQNKYPSEYRNDMETAKEYITKLEKDFTAVEVSFNEDKTDCDTRFYYKLSIRQRCNDVEI